MATLLELLKAQQKHEEEEEFEDQLPEMDALTLKSNDGYEFVIDKQTAMISLTIRNMLYGGANFEEAETKTICLPIRAYILEKIIQYLPINFEYIHRLMENQKFIDDKNQLQIENDKLKEENKGKKEKEDEMKEIIVKKKLPCFVLFFFFSTSQY